MALDRSLVVDANVIFAAMMKEGATRRLLLDPRLSLYAPQFLWEEIESLLPELEERSGVPRFALEALLAFLRERIVTVPALTVSSRRAEAGERLRDGDPSDAPYLATALALEGSIWSNDKGLGRRAGVEVLTTVQIMDLLRDPDP